MNLAEFGKKLAEIGLPILGAALPLPGGALLGAALAKAVTGSPDSGPNAILDAMASSTEALVAARQFELTHEKALLELAMTHEQRLFDLETKDRDSARRGAVDGGNSSRVFWLTVVIFLTVAGIEGFALVNGIPPGLDQVAAGRILGTLDAALLAALYYTFGSSAGSARKTEIDATSAATAVRKV